MPSPLGMSALAFSALDPAAAARDAPGKEHGKVSDAQLLALTFESRDEGFEAIYGTYKGKIYSFLLRFTGDPELADDLTQETFTKVYGALGSLTRDHKVLPWIYRIASNTATDHVRRRRRFSWLRIGALSDTAEEPVMADEHGRVPEREHVQATLKRLPPENAVALLLHSVEGYSYKEIADIQGCTMTAVRSRIARARESFRREYATK